ncbi:MAG: glycosyl hydrolase family 38, partial [Tannerellaceae bacterium]|nr:glycosyl hydrolase family 38 [Tannerellaceae bacterium]
MNKKVYLIIFLHALCMTCFAAPANEKKTEIKVTPRPAVLHGSNLQPVYVEIQHAGIPAEATLSIGNTKRQIMLKEGANAVEMQVEASPAKRTHTLELSVNGKTEKQKFTVLPVRKWKVNFVQHTHTDIGYTRSQTEILPELVRFIDYALDYCDATDEWPDDARFRYTCEASWAVSEY